MYCLTASAPNQFYSSLAWTFNPSYPTDPAPAPPRIYANIGHADGRQPLPASGSWLKAQPFYHELNGMNQYNLPLPPQVDHPLCEIQIHPLLAVGSFQRFDLSRRPSKSYKDVFSVAATFPSLPSLAIIIPSLPWVVVVHHSETAFVTIGDVLTGLWESLQTNLEETRSSRSADWMSKTHSVKRWLDLLKGKHYFVGISPSSVGEDTFLLHLVGP